MNSYQREIEDALSDSYMGAKSEEGLVESFTIKLKNTTGKAMKVVIIPGSFDTERVVIGVTDTLKMVGGATVGATTTVYPAVILKDNTDKINKVEAVNAVIGDGVIGSITDTDGQGVIFKDATGSVTASSDEFAISDFLNYIKKTPSVVRDMVITANAQDAFNSSIKVVQLSPFNRKGSYNIKLSNYLSERQTIDRKITVNVEEATERVLQLDNETLLILNMPATANGQANVEMDIQFNLVRRLSLAEMNMSKAIKA